MKSKALIKAVGGAVLLWAACCRVDAADTYVNLTSLFNQDAFVSGSSGTGSPLDNAGRWLQAATLPSGYSDGVAFGTVDGWTRFRFGPLKTAVLEGVRVQGQAVPVPPGQYKRLHLGLLATDGSMADLSRNLVFKYTDGSTQSVQIGPVPQWLTSPAAYADQIQSFNDRSSVTEYLNITPNVNDVDANGDLRPFVMKCTGSAIQKLANSRFMDGTSQLIYELTIPAELTQATLGIDMWNNFVVSLSKDGGVTFEEVLNSFNLYGQDYHSGANRKVYTVDLATWVADNPTHTIQVLFADGSTGDGWGPQVFNVSVYTGQVVNYTQRHTTVIDKSKATVFADFLADGGAQEKNYLLEESSAISGAGHRFADGNGYIVYELKLPAGTKKAKAAMNINGNFVVSAGPGGGEETLESIVPNVDDEVNGVPKSFVKEITGSALEDRPNSRFMDGTSVLTYELSLATDLIDATLKIDMHNNFVVALSKDGGTTYATVLNSQTMFGKDVHDGSNRSVYSVGLYDWLDENPTKTLRVRFTDGSTGDGWGPQVFKVSVTKRTDIQTLVSITPNVNDKYPDGTLKPWVLAATGSAMELRPDSRFMDGTSQLIYELDLPDLVTAATLKIDMHNNFVVGLMKETEWDFTEVLNSQTLYGTDIHNGSNRQIYELDLAPWLEDNPNRKLQVRFTDGSMGDGWGPQVFKVLVTQGQAVSLTPVITAVGLTQGSLVPYPSTGGQNKGYYTIDLSPHLAQSLTATVRIKLTDGTPENGNGPGIYRMLVFDGTLGIRTPGPSIGGLVPTGGLPANAYRDGANIVRREYALDDTKTLESFTLPTLVPALGNKLYLMAATLESSGGATLQIVRNPNDTVTLDWNSGGTLQSSGVATGGWEPAASQARPQTIPATGTQFYRVAD
jgi:hypothetical protein